jgi:hypothetical protein
METHIPGATIDANGMEFDHESNEWLITRRIFMNIPSDAIITSNSNNDDIINFEFDNVRLTIYAHAEPQITIVGHHYAP